MQNKTSQRTLPKEKTQLSKVSTIFQGKERENNIAILAVLATDKPMTTWELTRAILERRRDPAKHPGPLNSSEIRAGNSIFYRRIRSLQGHGFVERKGTVRSKAGPTFVYGLSFKGSLVATLLIEGKYVDLKSPPVSLGQVPRFVQHTSSVNPFSKLASICLQKGVSTGLVCELLIDSEKQAILHGLVNVEVADNEHLMTTVTSLLMKKIQDLRRNRGYLLEEKRLAIQSLQSDEAARAIEKIRLRPTLVPQEEAGMLAGVYVANILNLWGQRSKAESQRSLETLEAELKGLDAKKLMARLAGLES